MTQPWGTSHRPCQADLRAGFEASLAKPIEVDVVLQNLPFSQRKRTTLCTYATSPEGSNRRSLRRVGRPDQVLEMTESPWATVVISAARGRGPATAFGVVRTGVGRQRELPGRLCPLRSIRPQADAACRFRSGQNALGVLGFRANLTAELSSWSHGLGYCTRCVQHARPNWPQNTGCTS